MNSTRISGMLKLALGGIGFIIVLLIFQAIESGDRHPTHKGMIILGIPGAYGLTGLIELVAGVPFIQLSDAWDGLAGWQRGILGIFIVIAAFAIMMLGIVLFA